MFAANCPAVTSAVVTFIGSTPRAGGSGSGNISLPAGTQTGDTIILLEGHRNAGMTAPSPSGSGWATLFNDTSTQPSFLVMWRKVAAGETFVSVTASGSQGQFLLAAYRGITGLDVAGSANAVSAPNSTLTQAPALNATQGGALLVFAGWKSLSSAPTSTPSGVTQRAVGTGDGSLWVGDILSNPAGTAGTKDFTLAGGTTNQGYAFQAQFY